MLAPTRILVPTDFSPYSDRALVQALDIAKQYRAKVFLLHVLHEDVHRGNLEFTFPEDVVQRIKDGAAALANTNFQNQLNPLPRAKEVDVVTDIRKGIPYDEILKEEREKGIDLIVIASLGKTGLAKYFIGSVARNVLKGARCPVLLTR
ncbi:MAG: universal stress protein [Syntrophorhabdaceae bacterium]|nr:universal stress protein [Syntrophorhabdaceae bacterium]MDD4195733.1 universal stress protein [Syntrophorhabdaceae bacterium]